MSKSSCDIALPASSPLALPSPRAPSPIINAPCARSAQGALKIRDETSKPIKSKVHWSKPISKRGSAYDRIVIANASPSVKGRVVTVSFAAKNWEVTPRRIRLLLTTRRLAGRRLDNGPWEVDYPYRYQTGARGPVLRGPNPRKRGRPKSKVVTK